MGREGFFDGDRLLPARGRCGEQGRPSPGPAPDWLPESSDRAFDARDRRPERERLYPGGKNRPATRRAETSEEITFSSCPKSFFCSSLWLNWTIAISVIRFRQRRCAHIFRPLHSPRQENYHARLSN